MSIKLLNFLESKLAPSTIALEVKSLAFGSIASLVIYVYSKFHVCDFLIVHRNLLFHLFIFKNISLCFS